MREMGLRSKTVKRYVVTTNSRHDEPIAPNVLKREFAVTAPNIAWVTDITYMKVGRR